MRLMNSNDLAFLQSLLNKTEGELREYLYAALKHFYRKKDLINTKDYLFCKGNCEILLISHLDTVFRYEPKELFYDKEKNVLWSPTGAGFDDRAGIFAIIKTLSTGKKPYMLFTTQEERGGLGALKASTELKKEVEGKIKYMVELDRRGSKDCVFYSNDNKEFIEYVKEFGFEENWGTFSDIDILGSPWNIASVNLSIGYADEHTLAERLYVDVLYDTIEKVKKMIYTIDEAPFFEHVEEPYYEFHSSSAGINHFAINGSNYHKCAGCGRWILEKVCIPAKSATGVEYFCPDCSPKHINVCGLCGDIYETTPDDMDLICSDCRRNLK